MTDQVQSNASRQKRILITLAICVAAILLATLFSSMIQTAGWTYTTEDLRNATNSSKISLVPTDDGETEAKLYDVKGKVVSGILFRPKHAEAGSRPAVVFSHGLYNNREMQIQNAIEMVRRGYVVIVIDQSKHGHNTSETTSFFDTTHLDAAKYCYNLPEVDKSRIAVSGHSMGGYSTNNVLSIDGMFAGKLKDENFKAGKNMGIVSAYLVQAAGAPSSALNAPNVIAAGLVKGNADEFFYGGSQLKENTYVLQNRGVVTEDNYTEYFVKKGDEYVQATKFSKNGEYYAYTTKGNTYYYLQSKPAFSFTRGVAPSEADDWATINGGIYTNDGLIAQPDGRKLVSATTKGQQLASADKQIRVVYEAKETHPMNHCSTKTASHVIDFFYNAFGTVEGISYKAPTNQTWWLKEVFSAIGLIGLFAMLLPLIDLFLGAKAFASLKGEVAEAPILLTRPRKHVSYWLGGILTTIFGAVSFHNLVAEENWYGKLRWGTLLDNADAGFIYTNVGKIAAWGILCALFSIVVTAVIWVVNHVINLCKYGDDFAAHDEHPFAGFEIRSWGNIVKTLVLAAILVAIFYGVVNVIWATTRVQFQVWVFGTRVFDLIKLSSMMKYVPFFAIFYVTSAALSQGYRVKDLPEWATVAINVVFNVIGVTIMVWYANNYFITNGAMIHTTNNMHYIHAFPVIPSVAIATVMARRIYTRTGNAWLAGLVNAAIMTFIGCANTSFSGVVAWTYGV